MKPALALLCATVAFIAALRPAPAAPAQPAFPPGVSQRDAPGLLRSTEWVRSLDEAALLKLVPEQSGLNFVGCPNCTGGRQEGQLEWTPERPDEVHCRYCQHRYPSAKYPMEKAVTARSPAGGTHHYPYWEDAKGYRYFFQARRDDGVREYLAEQARQLARLSVATGDKAHARRAALILDRFAQVFPGWCYHYDYPFQQKEIYDGAVPPERFRPGYRTARWTWWAYMDVPTPLIQAYDWLRGSGALEELSRERGTDVAARIERDLFRNAAEQVLANREPYTNMSPSSWRSLIQLGRVIGEPRYVHEPVRRFRRFVETRFFYDGTWPEGSPDYFAQTLGGLESALTVLRGYSDPPGYKDPDDGSRFDALGASPSRPDGGGVEREASRLGGRSGFDTEGSIGPAAPTTHAPLAARSDPSRLLGEARNLEAGFPALQRARTALARMRLPDGRAIPVHDSWWFSRRGVPAATGPWLLPALGHACLGGGTGGDQLQLHLGWSGGYGHQHADNLGLLLFANGQEPLSDLGYTHTAYRSWTLATAAHNAVVIDGEDQNFGSDASPSDGRLRWFDTGAGWVQTVSVDGARAYPDKAKTYRRTLVLVDAGEGRRYAVDLFEVQGGRTHDYFLHGDADRPATVATSLPLQPLPTLLPAGFDWQPTRNEGQAGRHREPHYPYGFLKNLRAAAPPARQGLPVTFAPSDTGPSLRVTLFPEESSRLVLGENPSIRQAKEDDSQLERFQRPFLMLRREPQDGRSVFAAVLEPYGKAPFIDGIDWFEWQGATRALRVRIGDRSDFIVLGAGRRTRVVTGKEPAFFRGEVGVLSLRGDRVERAYALGDGGWGVPAERVHGPFRLAAPAPERRALQAIDGDTLLLAGPAAPLPKPGDVVRLTTADGWVYPYTVTAAEDQAGTLRLRVAEGPGLAYDPAAKRLRLTAFPQREHHGELQVEWLSGASGR